MNDHNTTNIAEAIVLLLAPFCEVIIHDLKAGVVKQVIGTSSNRHVGEPSFLDELEINDWAKEVHGPYRKTTPDGRAIKSISIVIRNDHSKPINLMCINMDVSHFESARAILANLTSIPEEELNNPLSNDWLERLHVFVANWTATQGVQISNIQPNMRIKLILKLKKNGVFKEKNSALAVAKALGVSRATIYQDLRDRVKEQKKIKDS